MNSGTECKHIITRWMNSETCCKHIITRWINSGNFHEYGLMQVKVPDIQGNDWIGSFCTLYSLQVTTG